MASKMRSPNYPAASLQVALEAAEKLWAVEKRTAIDHETAARAMGYKSLSGPARVMIGALRQYGLIEKAEKGHLRLSDTAVQILHGHGDEQAIALGQAALTPDLFLELSRSHLEASEGAIRSYLITKKQFADDGARKAAKAFKETVALGIKSQGGYTSGTAQEKPQAMTGPEYTGTTTNRENDGSGVLSLKVPYGNGSLVIDIRATSPLTKNHIAKVRRYLELAADDLPDDVTD